jgi:hypothetical protein
MSVQERLLGKKQVDVSYREITTLDKSIQQGEDAMWTLSQTPPELAMDIYTGDHARWSMFGLTNVLQDVRSLRVVDRMPGKRLRKLCL